MVTTSRPLLDSLFNFYFYIGLTVGLIVYVALIYAIIKYRNRPGQAEPSDAPRAGVVPQQRGNPKVALAMTVVVTMLLIPLSVGTFRSADLIENPPTDDALVIKVEGQRFGWTFTYPEGFKSRGELVVPVGRVVILEVTSIDVFHTFDIPEFRVKADAIPGKVNRIWFEATKPGVYNAFCAELCGVGHAIMRASVSVIELNEYESWRAENIGGMK